jgi:hypothetical protein
MKETGRQIWRVAVNILNKQLHITTEGWLSILGVGRGAKDITVKHTFVSELSKITGK